MSKYRIRYAFALAGFVAASIGAPLAPAFAASSNLIGNASVDARMSHAGAAGSYDGYDNYRDAKGFPLAGWDYLFFPPS